NLRHRIEGDHVPDLVVLSLDPELVQLRLRDMEAEPIWVLRLHRLTSHINHFRPHLLRRVSDQESYGHGVYVWGGSSPSPCRLWRTLLQPSSGCQECCGREPQPPSPDVELDSRWAFQCPTMNLLMASKKLTTAGHRITAAFHTNAVLLSAPKITKAPRHVASHVESRPMGLLPFSGLPSLSMRSALRIVSISDFTSAKPVSTHLCNLFTPRATVALVAFVGFLIGSSSTSAVPTKERGSGLSWWCSGIDSSLCPPLGRATAHRLPTYSL